MDNYGLSIEEIRGALMGANIFTSLGLDDNKLGIWPDCSTSG